MTKKQIRKITDKASQPCLVGMKGWDEDIQQMTCKCFNGEKCSCYRVFKKALYDYKNKYCNCKKPISDIEYSEMCGICGKDIPTQPVS